MKPMNINSACQSIKTACNENINLKSITYDFNLKDNEAESLFKFITILKENSADFNCFNGYYIGYEIKQISKEFDLLRFGSNTIINIELKGTLDEKIKIEKITKQMNKNFYYLNFLSKQIYIYTFVEDDGFYKYDEINKTAISTSAEEVIHIINENLVDYRIHPDNIFVPSNYLISPFNKTQEFLRDEYFLTGQQVNIKNEIMQCITSGKYKIFCVSANAGTGKTLLMYDIAKSLLLNGKKARIIHAGKLNQGHEELINAGWFITPIRNINKDSINFFDTDNMSILLVDEAHRIRQIQLDLILLKSKQLKIPVVFAYDVKQALSGGENKDICKYIADKQLNIPLVSHTLSNKIRSNKEMASFIKNLIHIGDSKDNLNYEDITIEYFSDISDMTEYIECLEKCENWKSITFTNSRYTPEPLDKLANTSELKAHDVIGQEFKKVVFVMDFNFQYNEQGTLMTTSNYYSAKGMLYQIITRATDELKIIVFNNYHLFLKLLEIKHGEFIKKKICSNTKE